MSMNKLELAGKKIWVTGHNGMVGSALIRQLRAIDDIEIQSVDREELDLEHQSDTFDWMSDNRPDIVLNCAAKVGGIQANRETPADFLSTNLAIGMNVIEASVKFDVQKLVCLGSSCFYPKITAQPITESALLTGLLEPTNEAYAIAKLATLKLCSFYRQQYGKDFIGIVPTNLYGTGDNFHPTQGHVISALIYKFVEAVNRDVNVVELWGTGKPLREFMHVDDAARGILFLTQRYSDAQHINLSGGETISIKQLANLIREIVGYQGKIVFDTTKPDGMMKKSLDNERISQLGWEANISLYDGLSKTIDEFRRGCF